MKKPTVHLNGTSAERLIDGYVAADNALRSAERALEESAPNGRDYYPQGDGAIGQAIKEHVARVEKLRAIRAEIQELLQHVGDS